MTKIEVLYDKVRIAELLEEYLGERMEQHGRPFSAGCHSIKFESNIRDNSDISFADIERSAPRLYADLRAAFKAEVERVRLAADFAGLKGGEDDEDE